MKFRFHRGGLGESLATEIEYSTQKELREYIFSEWPWLNGSLEWYFDIYYYGYDDRCDQHLDAVAIKSFTNKNTHVIIGFIYE